MIRVLRVHAKRCLQSCWLACLLSIAGAAHAENLRVQVQDLNGRPLADAIVIAVPVAGIKPASLKPHEEIVDQIDREFVPHVKPILVGSTVRFPNKDNIRHHVYSFSPAKTFQLPLYKGTPAAPELFDKPGVVVLGCNIHDWMVGYVYVAESPYFAKTEADGLATLTDLPRGDYRVRVWHPDLATAEEATVRSVTVDERASVPQLWQIAVKPQVQSPRTQAGSGGSYH